MEGFVEVKISPSIMVCKIEELKEYLLLFEKVGLDSIHFDVMDGSYVKNIMLGTNIYNDVKRISKLPVDIHLMVNNPENFLNYFKPKDNDRICFHPETTNQSYKLLQTIKDLGCKAGLVLNPGTPLSYLEECINIVDYVLVMTVNPGFAGQTLIPDAESKVMRVRNVIDKSCRDIDLFVDGNTTFDNSKLLKKAGANGFVVGGSSIVKNLDTFEKDYKLYTDELQKL